MNAKNVILFTIDALRRDVLGCYGSHSGLTPFLDSIQNRCVRFNWCQSTGPYTQASFPGLLTSSYFLEYEKVPSPHLGQKRTLLSEILSAKGIYTAAFHSNPYLSGYFGWNRSWNHFYDSMEDQVDELNPYIKGDVINEKVEKWLMNRGAAGDDQPFFLWIHYMDAHEPYAPAQKYVTKLDASIKLTEEQYLWLFKQVVLRRDISEQANVTLLRKLYQAHVLEVDEYARRFFDLLEKIGILKDSIIIITSDHGEEFGEHGGLSHDGKMYGELVNVPLIIFDPSLTGEQVSEKIVSSIDIPPTILYLFGLPPQPDFRGKSLFPTEKYVSQGCYGECIGKLSHKMKPTDKPAYYLQDQGFKIIYREEQEKWELYDLAKDPGERENIFGSSLRAPELKRKLEAFIRRNFRSIF